MSYDVHIPRCTHIKTNGTQCDSPALRGRRFCFFHKNWQGQRIQLNAQPATPPSFTMPVLEDAEAVQVALMQVMRLILAGQLDPKIAGLLLYALQTASINVRQMKLEPYRLEKIVISPRTVGDNGLGDDAWSEEEFQEDEEEEEGEEEEEEDSDEEEGEDSVDEENSENEEEQEEGEPAAAPAQARSDRSGGVAMRLASPDVPAVPSSQPQQPRRNASSSPSSLTIGPG
jgi:hypothetical protein